MSHVRAFSLAFIHHGIRVLAVSACCTAAAWAAETNDEERFDVLELRVLGATKLPAADIEAAIYPFLGPQRTFADVEQARQALERVYRDHGYGTVFVDVPEQAVEDDGVVRLRVTEGRLDRVRITGAKYFANGQIREQLPSLARGEVLHLPSFQAELEDLNRASRDRRITPVLRAGRTPGTVDVELKVEDELPVHAAFEANNRYTADTSETRFSANLSYDNLWRQFHSLSLQYQTAPEEPDEARVIAGTYVAPIPNTGHLLAVYAVDTNSSVTTVGDLNVLGAGRIYGVRYIMTLPEGGGLFHNVTFGGDFKDFDETIRLSDGSDVTPIQYVSWTAGYTANLITERTKSQFNVGMNFGIRGIGNDAEEFEYKRFKARPNFWALTGSLMHERPLLFGTRMLVRADAQYTVEPLISNEQFSIGGAESVRGYLESESLGDYGVSGGLELHSPSFAGWFGSYVSNLYLLSFYDAGRVQILEPIKNDSDPSLNQVAQFNLSSWGLGLRLAGFGGLEAELDWAYPLEDTDRVEAGDTRLHFQVLYQF